jgi:hypothetical protein
MKSKLMIGASALGVSALSLGAGLAPVQAAPVQEGLVNVYVEDTNVQIPIAVAANVCNVSVNVLATFAGPTPTDCEALAQAEAENKQGPRNRPVKQEGLINIALVDTNVQVPVAAAANLCGISVNILAETLGTGGTTCDAMANSSAKN